VTQFHARPARRTVGLPPRSRARKLLVQRRAKHPRHHRDAILAFLCVRETYVAAMKSRSITRTRRSPQGGNIIFARPISHWSQAGSVEQPRHQAGNPVELRGEGADLVAAEHDRKVARPLRAGDVARPGKIDAEHLAI
jgi:hypothetical protein